MGKLGEAQSQQQIKQLARKIEEWRLTIPAIFVLEVTKPFSFIASQALLLCEPVLSLVNQELPIADFADLLGDRSNLEHLIAHLEAESLEQ